MEKQKTIKELTKEEFNAYSQIIVWVNSNQELLNSFCKGRNIDDIAIQELVEFHSNTREWTTPTPLKKEQENFKPFPVDALPDFWGNYMECIAKSNQVSVDMPAVMLLGTLATCLQSKYRVKARFEDDYEEELSLFTLIIARSGDRKSSTLKHFQSIIKKYEKNLNEQLKPDIAYYNSTLKILNEKKIEIEKKIKNDKNNNSNLDEELKGIIYKIIEHEKKYVGEIEMYLQDFTPEALDDILSKNKGVGAIIDSEGRFFKSINGKYSKVADFDTVLAGYTADDVKIHRKSSNTKDFNPNISTIITTQPIVLKEVMRNVYFKEKGLLARFLYTYPKPIVNKMPYGEPIPKELTLEFEKRIYNMLEKTKPEKPYILSLDDKALKEYDEYFYKVTPLIFSSGMEIEPWLTRLMGLSLRIAGILHIAEGKTENDLIDVKTMKSSITIANYFKFQAEHTLIPVAEEEKIDDMKYALEKILNICKENNGYKETPIPRKKIKDKCRKWKIEELELVLNDLEEYGYIKQIPQPASNNKPSWFITVNPIWINKLA